MQIYGAAIRHDHLAQDAEYLALVACQCVCEYRRRGVQMVNSYSSSATNHKLE